MDGSADVVIVGAGIMGCSVAYWLAGEDRRVMIVEQESVAHGASGVAAAMLSAAAVDDPLVELSDFSLQLHRDLSTRLPEESGADYGYKENPDIAIAFTPEAAARLKARLPAAQARVAGAHWVEGAAVWEVEPRLSPKVLGGLVSYQSQVIASRFTLAIATAAERKGAEIRHGEVVGLVGESRKAEGVRLSNGDTIRAGTVVIAGGPWSGRASEWTGLRIPVYPVRGQILDLQAPDPQLRASVFGPEMYLVHKANGITLAGATEEHESGFAVETTPEGLAEIMAGAIEMTPFLADARLVHQVAGLRPGTADELPLIGPIPGWENLFIIAGHFRRGMELSQGSARVIADLAQGKPSPVSIAAFDPGRFGPLG